LITVANKTGVGSKLTKYAAITLPDFYYDKYVNPYDPVTKILDNGHKLVSTLQENQSIYTEETWEEDGYSFLKKYDGKYHPTIGKKIIGDTTYIKYKDLHSYGKSVDEKGFIVQKKYYLTNLRIQDKDLSIDYSHVPTDGYIIIDDNNGKHFAYIKNEDNKPYLTNYEVESIGTDSSVTYNVYKHIDNDGNITVPIDLTSELSTKAIEFKNFLNHPYVKIHWPSKTKITELTMTPDGELLPSQKDGYYEYILRMSRNPNNPMYQLQASIAMELNVPDYDITITKKIDEKVVGQRTAKLLKELPKSFITHLKDEKQMDLKKARVSRIIKQDKNISVYVTTIDKNGNENITKLMLEDNIPVDKYAKLWKLVTKNTK
nr:hypothetical protein [Muribaculaceae bacterium]